MDLNKFYHLDRCVEQTALPTFTSSYMDQLYNSCMNNNKIIQILHECYLSQGLFPDWSNLSKDLPEEVKAFLTDIYGNEHPAYTPMPNIDDVFSLPMPDRYAQYVSRETLMDALTEDILRYHKDYELSQQQLDSSKTD